MDDFAEIRKQQVAATKPDLYCVLAAKYEQTDLKVDVIRCFFTEREAELAMAYLQKNKPIDLALGWYEIEKTTLSVMK
jgi:hypothetical protein